MGLSSGLLSRGIDPRIVALFAEFSVDGEDHGWFPTGEQIAGFREVKFGGAESSLDVSE